MPPPRDRAYEPSGDPDVASRARIGMCQASPSYTRGSALTLRTVAAQLATRELPVIPLEPR